MLRTALKPRWIALLLLVLVTSSAMARLGEWQFERARDKPAQAQEKAREAVAPRPLLDLLSARMSFPASIADAVVVAEGTWDGARQQLVTPRRQDGRTGYWVLTPLRLADGSGIGIVRGWVATADDPAVQAPEGEVTVTGVLRPTEPAVERAPGQSSGLPVGTLERIDGTDLIEVWPYPLMTGYVVQTSVQPAAATPAPAAVPALSTEGGGLDLRSLSYAVQWWIFAGCGLFLWWRLVRDDHLGVGPRGEQRISDDGSTPLDEQTGDDHPVTATRGVVS